MDWLNVDWNTLLLCIAFGFFAQMIDGALGMAYGVSSNTLLLSWGLAPRIASACVHLAEVVTTLFSGLSHFKFGNVDKKLFLRLAAPGIVGGALGAYILSSLPGNKVKPFIAVYLMVMGAIILWKAFKKHPAKERELRKAIVPLGSVGGFFDAIGGGGWGPIVTTTLVANGKAPRMAIGTVNAAEFLVTVAESITFLLTIGAFLGQHTEVILGLLLGGVPAAPMAAYTCRRLPRKALMVMVGVLIIALSIRTLYLAVH